MWTLHDSTWPNRRVMWTLHDGSAKNRRVICTLHDGSTKNRRVMSCFDDGFNHRVTLRYHDGNKTVVLSITTLDYTTVE